VVSTLEGLQAAQEEPDEEGKSDEEAVDAGGRAATTYYLSAATSSLYSPLRLWLDGLGRILFVVALWGCVCRADAAAAVALLVLTNVCESRLYFSRVLVGAIALSLSLDAVWLQQEMPDIATALFGGGLRAVVVLAAQLPLVTAGQY
jgi:hypothetical protein